MPSMGKQLEGSGPNGCSVSHLPGDLGQMTSPFKPPFAICKMGIAPPIPVSGANYRQWLEHSQ